MCRAPPRASRVAGKLVKFVRFFSLAGIILAEISMCCVRFVGFWGMPDGVQDASPILSLQDRARVVQLKHIALDLDEGGAPASHIYLALVRDDGSPLSASQREMLRVGAGIPRRGVLNVGTMCIDMTDMWVPCSGIDHLYRLVAGVFDADENLLAAARSCAFRIMSRKTCQSRLMREDSPLIDHAALHPGNRWVF